MAEVREGLFYNAQHDWVRVEGDAGVLGITDYAQGELGDIVFLELPAEGAQVSSGQAYGTVEAVKTVADLISPVSGEVIAVNRDLEEDAARVNSDPYGEGWIIKVRLSDPGEIKALMDASAYGALLAG
jgi:glycine cleavage system H protein